MDYGACDFVFGVWSMRFFTSVYKFIIFFPIDLLYWLKLNIFIYIISPQKTRSYFHTLESDY